MDDYGNKKEARPTTPDLNGNWSDTIVWTQDFINDNFDGQIKYTFLPRNECYVKSDCQHIHEDDLREEHFRSVSRRVYLQQTDNMAKHGKFLTNYLLERELEKANLQEFI